MEHMIEAAPKIVALLVIKMVHDFQHRPGVRSSVSSAPVRGKRRRPGCGSSLRDWQVAELYSRDPSLFSLPVAQLPHRFLRRIQPQRRALEPGAGDLAAQDVQDDIGRSGLDIGQGFPGEHLGDDGARGLADGASLALERDVGDASVAIYPQVESDNVTAAGVAALLYDRCVCQRPVVSWALIVIQYEVDLCLAIHDAALLSGSHAAVSIARSVRACKAGS